MLASFYGTGDEVNLAFNLMFLHAKFDADEIREIVEAAERAHPGRVPADVDRGQPRQPAVRDPLGRQRPDAGRAPRCSCC